MKTNKEALDLIFHPNQEIFLSTDPLTLITFLFIFSFLFIFYGIRLISFYLITYEDRHKILDDEMTRLKIMKNPSEKDLKKIKDLSYSLHPKSKHISLRWAIVRLSILGILTALISWNLLFSHHTLIGIDDRKVELKSYLLKSVVLNKEDVKEVLVEPKYEERVPYCDVTIKEKKTYDLKFFIPPDKCDMLMTYKTKKEA